MSNLPRSSTPTGARGVPDVAMGYCFLAENTSDKTFAALVIKDRNSRAILARPALRKGRLATIRSTEPSPASGGSGTIIGSCSRPIMSLRCWACDG
eukprot:4734506-Alexandrium_andersonii.AAC.1